ncbi:thioredoxin domain-containing protein [Geminicoccus roseus]|uniref:thioredoxin domain-containing protein n=1 Tax=Geminicoccus roseus TaxID=404900 RepID=UPI0004092199|nr:thioredoxin domain-containing protein [Geminicoccus roseus]
MANLLRDATSPYLLQHADNPVHWREWNEASLALARERDVPILLSVGYAACHWCHVMAHESFENEAIARLMNEHFVPIKVDREERPDLDQIYMHALHLLGEQGGWPLTMFLTPAGEPFWGGTYFPPEPRYGRPSFTQVLEQLSRIWREDRDRLLGNRDQLVTALAELGRPAEGEGVALSLVARTAKALAQRFDTIHGGLQGAPKFPQGPILDLLRRVALATGDQTIERRLLHTLARISQGGIYDHLGGGYARYSVDAFWLVPHFEKMLYDNAQLLGLLAELHLIEPDPLFHVRADETVEWLSREMMTEGAFAAALDADSEGEEGKFYCWDAAEVAQVLGPDFERFALAYGVTEAGNWEGRNVLNRLHQPGLLPPDEEEALAPLRAKLLEARELRPRPARDDKMLADWNGLMIQGLARAGVVFDEPDWLALAASAWQAAMARLGTPAGGVRHAWRAGRRLELGLLDDHAQMARAALALYEASAEPVWLERAIAILEAAEQDFADPAGGYRLTASGATDLLVRPKTAYDGPTPAALATFLECLAITHVLDGRPQWRERADRLVRSVAGEVNRQPAGHAAFLAAVMALEAPVQVALVGSPTTSLEPLRRVALTTALPHRTVQQVADGEGLPPHHPAHGKGMVDGRPTAYVCVAATCTPPITEAAGLAEALAAAALRVGAMGGN